MDSQQNSIDHWQRSKAAISLFKIANGHIICGGSMRRRDRLPDMKSGDHRVSDLNLQTALVKY